MQRPVRPPESHPSYRDRRVRRLWRRWAALAVGGLVLGLLLLSGLRGAFSSAEMRKHPAQMVHANDRDAPPERSEAETSVTLVSLFWPPYAGEALPFGGSSTQKIRAILAKAGLSLQVDYVPWPRAMAMFAQGTVDGIYPEYPERDGTDGCIISLPYQDTELSLVERPAEPLKWTTLADLQPILLGVVRGYFNSPAFDRLVDRGILTVEAESTDLANIRKVAAGRIDGAAIDPAVFQYLMEHEAGLQPLLDMVQINPQPIARRSLHICFHNTERGHFLRDTINQGITAAMPHIPSK